MVGTVGISHHRTANLQEAGRNNGATAGKVGHLDGHTVEPLAVPNAPAKASGIGARIAHFFTTSLPRALTSAADLVMSLFRSAGPASVPPVNGSFNEPFGRARLDDLRDEIRDNVDPQNLSGTMVDVVVDSDSGTTVARTFALDINRAGEPYYFNGVPMDDVMAAPSISDHSDAASLPRVKAWCDSMERKGVSVEDMAVISRVVNQSLFGILQSQYALRPDLAPPLKTADGREAMVSVDLSSRKWNIRETEAGFAVDFEGSGALSTMAATDGSVVQFRDDSSARIAFSVALDRDDAGALQVAAVSDGSLELTAFDLAGRRLA